MSNDSNRSKHVPIGEGWNWFVIAILAARKQLFRLFLFVMFYTLTMGFLSVLPVIGVVFAALFMPFGTILLGYGVRDALHDKVPSFACLRQGFENPYIRKNLLFIGLVFATALIFLSILYDFLSASYTAKWVIDANNRVDWQSVAQNFPWIPIGIVVLLYIPVLMATWFSPMLAIEKHMTWGKSLFYSFFGCLKNILPIIMLGLVIIICASTCGYFSVTLVEMFGLQEMNMYVYLPVFFICMTVIYSTYWPMYESLFGSTRSDATLGETDVRS